MKYPKNISFRKIFSNLKSYPVKQTIQSLKYLPRVFGRLEKIVLLGLSIAVIAFLAMIFINRWINSTEAVAQNGGIFREGIIGESKDLDKNLPRLINAGLTKYDLEKNIVGDMAEKWEIQDEGKTYTFYLKPQFDSQDLANQITSSNHWPGIEVATPEPTVIQFKFKQPFSPFLYTSTEPIFTYGPYRITKESKNEVELTAREDYYAGRPYIDKIIIKFYPDQDALLRAAKRGEIDGFALTTETPTVSKFNKLTLELPRQLMVFFNLSNSQLQDINVRKSLKENGNPGRALEFRLVTSDNQKNVDTAKSIAEKWSKNNFKINLDIKDNVTLQKTTIPKRDYDILLYGLDYGEDPDPYPFWHSSQINPPAGGDGRNLSNFKNTKADKLLEEARQEFDFKKREEKYNEFGQILDQEIPAFEVSQDILYYQASNKVKGLEKIIGSFEADRFLNVFSWYLNTKRVRK